MGNKTVFKNNNPTLYAYSQKKSIKLIIYNKILKTQYVQRIFSKISKINDCFENITHEPISFCILF